MDPDVWPKDSAWQSLSAEQQNDVLASLRRGVLGQTSRPHEGQREGRTAPAREYMTRAVDQLSR